MDLGACSVSLAVKDLAASREFYSALGFEVVGGQADEGEGPAHITLRDPDGNAILIDQHR